jgi:lysozyme
MDDLERAADRKGREGTSECVARGKLRGGAAIATDVPKAVRVETEPELSLGDGGEAVVLLREALAAAGFPVDASSQGLSDEEPPPLGATAFDEATAHGVRVFQDASGLEVDGIANEETWAALAVGTSEPAESVSEGGLGFISSWEGFSPTVYNDPAGHCTIGFGHLVHYGNCNGSEPDEFRAGITRGRALQLLEQEANEFAAAVTKAVRVGLGKPQLDALTSFSYNVGAKAFRESTLLRLLNEGRYDTVPAQLMRWIYSGGKPYEGLRRRRRAEGALVAHGDYGDGSGPADMSVRQIQAALREIGWPVRVDGDIGDETHAAISDFQRGFAFCLLSVDGHAGPKTQAALRKSLEQGGRCAGHFTFREFRSRGNGWIKVARQLVIGLEEYRELVGGPVRIISGYRDPAYNASIPGAAKNSQHVYGNAADVDPVKPRSEVARIRRFSGIGFEGSTERVRHVDVRHVGPNTTGNTVENPAQWPYGFRLLPAAEEAEELESDEPARRP